MGAKAWLAAMAIGSVVVLASFRRDETPREEPEPQPIAGPYWLSREAAAQLVVGGMPGPLFADVVLGTPASPETRERIAAFAREHELAIDLETVDGDVHAIRIEVTFRGGYGFEGADVFALKLRRPTRSECCGCKQTWIDDWTVEHDHGVFMRASVRANRVAVRWERALTLREVKTRAKQLVGAKAATVRDAAGDRWIERGERRYRIEVPYARGEYMHEPVGIDLLVERGTIVSATFVEDPTY